MKKVLLLAVAILCFGLVVLQPKSALAAHPFASELVFEGRAHLSATEVLIYVGSCPKVSTSLPNRRCVLGVGETKAQALQALGYSFVGNLDMPFGISRFQLFEINSFLPFERYDADVICDNTLFGESDNQLEIAIEQALKAAQNNPLYTCIIPDL